MRALGRLLLEMLAFLVVAATSLLLIVLEQLARPLRFANIRALALIATIHASEVPPAPGER